MKIWIKIVLCIVVLAALAMLGCSKQTTETAETATTTQTTATTELMSFAVASTDGLLTQSGITLDTAVTNDGNGSLRVTATEPTTYRLYETGDVDIENARLIYEAKLRTEDIDGQVYIEMWCHFPGKGEFFSRALHDPLSGTVEWTHQKTPFFLKQGENPDNVKLNLVVNGTGTVWIDDIKLVRRPL